MATSNRPLSMRNRMPSKKALAAALEQKELVSEREEEEEKKRRRRRGSKGKRNEKTRSPFSRAS